MIETTINGRTQQVDVVHPDETVVELLRRNGLTGTKMVCGSGVCGACTVLVDGVPMTSCLLPVQQIAGREVQTVEFHDADNLHPVQRALMACDGLQCGFCTPGFVNSGIAFYQQWRAENGTQTPSREEIAQGLAGNLCRCGAYEGIYEALAAACAGEFDHAVEIESPRHEALEKVTGRARYTVDIQYEGQLEGALLRSIHPHATVLEVDPAEALALPGVVAYADLLGGERTVRYVGQVIGAVAAVDMRTARAALQKIQVRYEVHSAAVGPEAARSYGAPTVFSGLRKNPPIAAEGMVFPGRWQGNLRKTLMVLTGSAGRKARGQIGEAQARQDDALIQRRFENAVQVHTALEPHACVARWQDPFHLTVHLSTQSVHETAHLIAEHFDLEEENVAMTAAHVGGGFGGKHGLQIEAVAAITLARMSDRPVRVALTRLEEMSYAGYRPGAEVQISLLTGEESAPRALSAAAYSDNGVGVGGGVSLLLGMYSPDVPRHLEEYDIVNHTPPGKPFRGPNGPQALWAMEQMIDEAAHRHSTDPLLLRKRWYPDDPLRQKLLDWAAGLPVWAERAGGKGNGRFRRGVGVSTSAWPFLYNGNTEVIAGIAGGQFFVRTATQDIGTGTRTLLAQAVAGVFGIPGREVNVELGISGAPLGPASGGSQVSNSVYGPAVGAAERLREQLVAAVAAQMDLGEAEAQAGGIGHAGGFVPWATVLAQTEPLAVVERRGSEPAFMRLLELMNRDEHSASIGRGQSVGVTVTQVEVDTRLGKIRPLGVWEGIAAGRIFVPALARSQVEGGIIQGLGYALYEERQIDLDSGYHLSANLEDYKIPGIGDVPPLAVMFLEEGFEEVRGGGIGLSELSTVGVAASVGNAVFDATGWRPLRTPIKPQDVVEGVRA